MRLTLRTLLAYLDDVLDPADKEELARKIESSDFAKDLVHQTRDSVRRLRLSAPQVIGAGMGMDPNTVAEYLDNALPPEQVGDYERICLESDVHLAETAACHHVLTMVLGEPAEVEPRSRQRMYLIPAEARERRRLRAEPAHAKKSASATTVSSLAPGPAAGVSAAGRPQAPATRAVEIPEYLRARPWWQSRSVLAALAAVLVVGTALYFVSDMMGWFGGGQEVAGVDIDRQAPTTASPAEPIAEVVTTETTPAPTDPNPAQLVTSSTPPATGDTAPVAETGAAAPSPAPPQGVAPEIAPSQSVGPTETTPAPEIPDATAAAVGDAAANPADTIAEPAEAPAVVTPPTEESPAATSASVGPALPEATEAAPVAVPSEVIPPPAAATPDAPAVTAASELPTLDESPAADPTASLAATTPPPSSQADAGSAPVEGDAVPKGPPELGTYLSGKTVLLRYDPPKGGWFRVEPRSAVVAGERLLSLPEFRPTISLASGLALDLSGGTLVEFTKGENNAEAGPDDVGASAPMIEVLYGRIVLMNTSNADSQIQLKAGAIVGKAVIERNATLALEVERPYVPGNDPRTTSAPVNATLFAPNGGVTWTDASGEIVVENPSRWHLVEGTPAEVVADSSPPEWIDREPVVHLSEQKYGAPVIEETLTSDRPVDIQLLELFKGRDRREVKSLVTRSSIHVGLFAPFIDALRDPEQRLPTWRSHIETLRSAMAQSPEAAELVFKALVDQRGRPAATDLYEMLCGYNAEQIGTTPEEVKAGAIAQLIDRLEDDSLDYRVLAVHDLWEITGKQLMPNPTANAAMRKRSVSRWRDQLESNELRVVKRKES